MFRAPRPAHLPHLHSILNDIGQPVQALANLIDVDASTLRRYKAAGQAPRTVMLALFWETSWGRSQTDTETINQARLMYQENQSLKLKNKKLERIIEKLEAERGMADMAANSPFYSNGSGSV